MQKKSNSTHLTIFRKPYHKIICGKYSVNKKPLSIPRNNSAIPSVMVILKHVNGAYYNKCLKSIYKGELITYKYVTKMELNRFTAKGF